MKNIVPLSEKQLILAHILKKSREYVLAHPEIRLTKKQEEKRKKYEKRRLNHEPLAYILGHKEFYGLDFKVTPDTLIPRPETELIVELTAWNIKHGTHSKGERIIVVDVGTGSGNIIISIAHNIKHGTGNKLKLYGIDTSAKAIQVARFNSKLNNSENKIEFVKGNLLEPIMKNEICSMFHDPCSMIIVANLPYLSQKIYASAMPDVKNFEPKSALFSKKDGLDHYEELFKQIKILDTRYQILNTIIEFSPEQKPALSKLIKKYFSAVKPKFKKDLAGKWRLAVITT
ncbi:MAG: release factor glutamine methyltransferase [Patescibacteria group bacterium]|nr:release factor glutamine methyltransferase [Patescibacteria group bacterium]